ncbi:MAG: hypothetical protein JNM84_16025 [Planctomycetes bacterium]|nr:hypothetical protein [Planctomycetota bacterium]
MLRHLSLVCAALVLCSGVALAQAQAYILAFPGGTYRLHQLDLTTGQTASRGDLAPGTGGSLAWGGTPPSLWAADRNAIGTLSTSNASFTPRRALGLTEDVVDLAWSATLGEFWITTNAGGFTWVVRAYHPATNALRTIGSIPGGVHLGDIAIDAAGAIWGLWGRALVLVDPQTLAVRFVSMLDRDVARLTIDPVRGTFLGIEGPAQYLVEIDPATGRTRPIALIRPGGEVVSLTIVPGICTGRFLPTGPSCPGTGGIAPVLDGFGCYGSGGTVHLSLSQAMSGTTGFLLFGLDAASVPLGNGCTLNIGPVFADPLLALPLFGTGGAGRGFTTVSFTVPTGTLVAPLALQALIFDLGAPGAIAATNGLRIVLG